MKTRTHFAHRIDMLDAAGEIQEHLAGVEDYILAEAVWRQAIERYQTQPSSYARAPRVVRDSRRPRVVEVTASLLRPAIQLELAVLCMALGSDRAAVWRCVSCLALSLESLWCCLRLARH
jgi:hypothetical protein